MHDFVHHEVAVHTKFICLFWNLHVL